MTVSSFQFGADQKPEPTTTTVSPEGVRIGGSYSLNKDGSLATSYANAQSASGDNGEEGILNTARRNGRPIPASMLLPTDLVKVGDVEMTVESAQMAGLLKKRPVKATRSPTR